MNYLYMLLPFIVVLTGVGLYFFKYKAQTEDLFSILKEECQEKQAKALWAIKEEFNIADDAWKSHWDGFNYYAWNDDLFGAPAKPLPKTNDLIVTLFNDILIGYGVNPDRVELEIVKNKSGHELAQAYQGCDQNGRLIHKIEINYDAFMNADPGVNEVVLRHEIMHLICYDALSTSYVRALLQDLGFTDEHINKSPSFIAYNHDMELRADRLSLCMNKPLAEYAAQMYQWAAQKIKKEELIDDSITHPTYEKRYTEIKKLCKRMN